MSCANTPHVVIEDDEFDWEAAVREIDVACQEASSTVASTSASIFSRPLENGSHLISKKPCASRQSTLDRFIQNRQSVNHCSIVSDVHEDEVRDGGGGGGEDFNDDNNRNAGCYCKIDLEAAKTWIYPVNIPLRDYQLSITKTALFANTLVALPTGLGKTFIAAVVMYNYFRWFPEGKIVFTAPSRPLVMQQIEACHNTVGIPQEWTIDLTGQTSASQRACLWKTKRVFFVTPQVLEKDIQSGTCLTRHLVCLVIDEAHRASGNYSYCVAVRELMAVPLQFRVLALTATPGSNKQTIQQVIDNLQISKLEYRNESDHDVSPHVHNRRVELIKLAMGKDDMEINELFLVAIRPYVAKLTSLGVHLNRDVQTLSPMDLLNTRDKFRQAPPQDLSDFNSGEVERYLGVLITLCHIRKVLSSHGIRPAYDVLEEKLQQGYFKKNIGKNEAIWRTKLLMQQSLSRGASNPKLSKLREILTDHFRTNDPKNSRVIIFSHYRDSVRDILTSVSSIGESVKATEFTGQSSGKLSKGQTQKVQQAILQKFRAGGYNIIVATSIAEEGLDIMEVDLVICFDANISPLRMIQRMGRTGRKHDGRVVILACEGSELKGYTRKQAHSKSVKRHMLNGGMRSFDFHSSPRMIPHICKPQVNFVEFAIEQFVHRGQKLKENSSHDLTFKDKLSDAEMELVTKYFCSSGKYAWRPSLIAFPHFQSFPSRVHNIMHSCRTRMFIGTMQHLQALSFPVDSEVVPVKGNTSSNQCLGAKGLTPDDRSAKDFISFEDSLGAFSERKLSDAIFSCTDQRYMSDSLNQNLRMHCFLFETISVSVGPSGSVSIASVPSLPFVKGGPFCMGKADISTELPNVVKPNSSSSRTSVGDICKIKANLANPTELDNMHNCFIPSSHLCNSNTHVEPALDEVENVVATPSPNRTFINSEVIIIETPPSTIRNIPNLLANTSTSDVKDVEMSPRLTNMVENGVVPESPIGDIGDHSCNVHAVDMDFSSEHVNCDLVQGHANGSPKDNKLHSTQSPHCEPRRQCLSPLHASFAVSSSLPLKDLSSEKTGNVKDWNSAGVSGYATGSPINVSIRTPLVEMRSCGSARGKISGSPNKVEHRTPLVNLTNSCSNDWHLSSGEQSKSIQQIPKFKRLRKYGESNKRISSKTMKNNLMDPSSNIINPTARSNPVKQGKRKMVTHAKAFIEEEAEVSSDAEVSDDEEEENDYSSNDDSFIDDRINPTMESTQAEAIRSDMMAIYRRSLLTQSPMPMESEPKVECRKRKLSFPSLQPQRLFEAATVDTFLHPDDEDVFEGLDLDALEAQATQLLKTKSDLPPFPSFDLGI